MRPESAIERLLDYLQRSVSETTFVGLRLSGPTSPSRPLETTDVRLIDLKGTPHLSFVSRETRTVGGAPPTNTRVDTHSPPVQHPDSAGGAAGDTAPMVVTRNLTVEDGIQWVRERLGGEFINALLRTTRRDWQLHRPATGEPRLVSHKPSASAAPSRQHDERKNTLLGPAANDWLQAIGVTHASGRPRVSMADKHRQISRYMEILLHLARDCGWTGDAEPDSPPLTIADMGCGKGYLTFAAWHLFHRTLRRPASVIGIEARPRLVHDANGVAQHLHMDGLKFIQGDIASVHLPKVDVLIALHACNTATDDAIRRGLELGSQLIVVAPCCHQALRPQLGEPEPLAALLGHGLFKERLAEWLTDGLRTLFLEWAGYQTKVIEFVASDHTPKNLMIAAVRKHEPFKDPAKRQRIMQLKQFFGIQHHALDGLLE